jgi:hypothetical protein
VEAGPEASRGLRRVREVPKRLKYVSMDSKVLWGNSIRFASEIE